MHVQCPIRYYCDVCEKYVCGECGSQLHAIHPKSKLSTRIKILTKELKEFYTNTIIPPLEAYKADLNFQKQKEASYLQNAKITDEYRRKLIAEIQEDNIKVKEKRKILIIKREELKNVMCIKDIRILEEWTRKIRNNMAECTDETAKKE